MPRFRNPRFSSQRGRVAIALPPATALGVVPVAELAGISPRRAQGHRRAQLAVR